MSSSGKVYGLDFYKLLSETSYQSAVIVLGIVKDLLTPKSLVDLGCGSGTWLRAAMDYGIADCTGIDGDWAKAQQFTLPGATFIHIDLEESLMSAKKYSLGRKYDLAISLEVAEHLNETCADSFVELLTDSSDIILFSAAVPFQGGTSHVNEKWQSYWAEKFERRGYLAYDQIRPKIWANDGVEVWYRQNSIFYIRDGCAPRNFGAPRHPKELDVIHPEMFASCVNEIPMRQAYRTVFDIKRYTRYAKRLIR